MTKNSFFLRKVVVIAICLAGFTNLQAQVSYAELPYPNIPTDGSAITGSVNADDNAILSMAMGGTMPVVGTGYSFQVQTGKEYSIDCSITSNNFVGGIYLLNATLTGGGFEDMLEDTYPYEGELGEDPILSMSFEATFDGTVKILLLDFTNGFDYELKVDDGSVNSINAISADTENAIITGYFDVLGRRLKEEPATGIYIIQYNNGTTKKVTR